MSDAANRGGEMMNRPALLFGSQVLSIEGPHSVVGRQDRTRRFIPDVDLTELDPSRSLSRRHAELTVQDGRAYLRDAGSTNGSAINGVRLVAGRTYPLRDGDAIAFGDLHGVFREGPSLAADAVAPQPDPPPSSPSPEGGGSPRPVFCEQCGHQARPRAHYCARCGARLPSRNGGAAGIR